MFVVSKIKNTVLWIYVIIDLNGEPITGSFSEKELETASQEKFRIERVINCMSNGKDMVIHVIVGSIKKTLNEISSYKNESTLS